MYKNQRHNDFDKFIYLCDRYFFFPSHYTTMSNTLTTNKILLNELQNTLNELINRNDLNVKTTELSNELFETTKIVPVVKIRKQTEMILMKQKTA